MADTLFSQHLPSNQRVHTDEFLMGTTSQFDYGRNREEISLRKNAHEHICITDSQVASIREASGNTKTRGDIVAEVLAQDFRQYEGMIDPNKDYVLTDEEEQGILSVTKHKKKIDTALYCFDDCATYYFLV